MFSFDHRRATRRHGVLSPVRTQRSVMALGVVAVLLAACGSDPATSAPNSSSGPDDTQVMEPPVISSFTADPTRIVEGETALPSSWVMNDPKRDALDHTAARRVRGDVARSDPCGHHHLHADSQQCTG